MKIKDQRSGFSVLRTSKNRENIENLLEKLKLDSNASNIKSQTFSQKLKIFNKRF